MTARPLDTAPTREGDTAPTRTGHATTLPDPLARDGRRVLLGHLLVWFLGAAAILPGLDRYGDMHELYAWAQPLAWGNFKHPPLLTWIVGAWFTLFPTRDWAFHLLAVLNATVAIWLVGRLTAALFERDPQAPRWAWLAMVAAALSLAHGNLALKLNMNSVLLPLWPLAAWAWWCALQRPGWVRTILLALAGAACMLGKYYSGVLLLALLLATVLLPAGRAWLRTPHPWVAGVLFVLLLLPHIGWVLSHELVTWRYVQDQDGPSGWEARDTAQFLAMAVVAWLPAALALGWAGRPWRRVAAPAVDGALDGAPGGATRQAILALAFGPVAISLGLAWAMDIELSSPWALPLGYAYAAVMLAWWRPGAPWPLLRRRALAALAVYWVVMLAGGAWVTWGKAQRGHPGDYLPHDALARFVDAQPVAPQWVGGDWVFATALAFYSEDHPRAFPGLPTEMPGRVHAPADWATRPGLIICPVAPDAPPGSPCADAAVALAQAQGLRTSVQRVRLQREGWRFPRQVPHGFDLVWLRPAGP